MIICLNVCLANSVLKDRIVMLNVIYVYKDKMCIYSGSYESSILHTVVLYVLCSVTSQF